jgi:hypothetical protein
VSCSSGGDDPPRNQGDIEGFENPGQIINAETQEPYTGSGKIYMAEERESHTGNLILTEETMLLVGTMNNGEITFNLPQTVDSHFLMKANNTSAEISVNPSDVEAWFYLDAYRLIDNSGKHIDNIIYAKESSNGNDRISYSYFSKDAKITGMHTRKLDSWTTEKYKYEINAKKGWNKIYQSVNRESISANGETVSIFITTDMSKVPDGLAWMFREN